MATAKQQQITDDMTTTDTVTTDTLTNPAPTASPQDQINEWGASGTWGKGGRFVIDEHGQRVLATTN